MAGVVGVAAMTAAEKLEQRLTMRPNSYVPARTLLTLLGRRPSSAARPTLVNHAMHWGTGLALGTLRGVWAGSGLRGPWTWPRTELVVDVMHKAIYSFVTGAVADRVIAPPAQPRSGRISR
jgi:hypothetical protein